MPIVVGFSGKRCSGKDTACQYLKEVYRDKNVCVTAFAKAVKLELEEIFSIMAKAGSPRLFAIEASIAMRVPYNTVMELSNIAWETRATNTVSKKTEQVMQCLQYWATTVRRGEDENYWVNKTVEDIGNFGSSVDLVLVSDVRFENELKALKELGAKIVRINISEDEQQKRSYNRDGVFIPSKVLTNISETELDNKEELFDLSVDSNYMPHEIIKSYVDSLLAGDINEAG